MSLRNKLADLLEETAQSRRASSRSSAVIGRTLRHFGVATVLKTIAGAIRVENEEDGG